MELNINEFKKHIPPISRDMELKKQFPSALTDVATCELPSLPGQEHFVIIIIIIRKLVERRII